MKTENTSAKIILEIRIATPIGRLFWKPRQCIVLSSAGLFAKSFFGKGADHFEELQQKKDTAAIPFKGQGSKK